MARSFSFLGKVGLVNVFAVGASKYYNVFDVVNCKVILMSFLFIRINSVSHSTVSSALRP